MASVSEEEEEEEEFDCSELLELLVCMRSAKPTHNQRNRCVIRWPCGDAVEMLPRFILSGTAAADALVW